MLTHERLKELFDYNPDTGWLFWKESKLSPKWIGKRAGGRDRRSKYRKLFADGSSYLEHRAIWFWVTGHWPEETIHHKNHTRDDNRFCNLMEMSLADNNRESAIFNQDQPRAGRKNRKHSLPKGVYKVPYGYQVQINDRKKRIFASRTYHDVEEASKVYQLYKLWWDAHKILRTNEAMASSYY